ncbi:hypothetical protein [Bradyrhizobium sp. Ce-3]|uniref:hypothetical protein n=1 Tax=Bradyrhizobium sp. Ce-3 TaxID=2913970 RepID=UPI001FB8A576|nr:hypothetical protein [Bradyrhizobium sp. Ce-3]
MPLPSQEQTFGFANCHELLQKLDREIDRYRDVAGRDEAEPEALVNLVDQLKDSAFNASITAWHLSDWVFSDMTLEQRKKLGIKKLSDLQNRARKACNALHLCRQAATASKHWAVSKNPDPTVRVTVACELETGWLAYFEHAGKKIRAEQVFAEALSFWTGFIYQHGIARES